MSLVVTIIHVAACFFLIAVVLLQTGKGADIGAVFGGSSQTIFGSSGAGNLLTRLTTWTAAVFMVTSIFLTWNSTRHLSVSIADDAPVEPPPLTAPADTGTTTVPDASAPAANAPEAKTEGTTDSAAPASAGAPDGVSQPNGAPAQAANAATTATTQAGDAAKAAAAKGGEAAQVAPQPKAAPAKAGEAGKATTQKAAPKAKTEGERAPDAAAAGVP